jgi:ABC-type phosphate transport system permease subunit
MTIAMLLLTAVLMLVGAGLFVASYRRRETAAAMTGMTVMIIGTVPAIVYAGLSS